MFSSTNKEVAREGLSHSSNIIGKETSLEGDLNTSGNLRVEGKVVGSIQTKAKVVLGDTSVVKGDIIAQTAEIGGEVHGTIKVSGLLTLKSTAVVNGDIITNKLVFEEGAKFNGTCSMGTPLKGVTVTQPTAIAQKSNDNPAKSSLQQIMLSKKEV